MWAKTYFNGFWFPKEGRGKFMCERHGAGVDSPEAKANLVPISYLFLLHAIKIWSELCCQSTRWHLPQLSAKFQAWKRHLTQENSFACISRRSMWHRTPGWIFSQMSTLRSSCMTHGRQNWEWKSSIGMKTYFLKKIFKLWFYVY